MTNTRSIRENRQLLKKLLSEALVASKADQWPGFKPKKPWESDAANFEKLIKALGSRPFPLPFGGSHSYEISVGDDYIYLHQGGEAYSTNRGVSMYYGLDPEFSKTGLVLYKEPAKKTIEGAIERVNGRITWKPAPPEQTKERTEETWVDYVQYALSIFGVIPGIGDVADIINAAISFYRYDDTGETMYLVDGFINIIGAIPVVGSFISAGLKIAFKSITGVGELIAKAWRSKKSATELWQQLHSTGALDAKTLNMLTDGMGYVADAVKGFRNRADWALNDTARKSLDEFADFMYANRRSAQDVFSGAAKRADDVVQGGGKVGRGKGILKTRAEVDWGLVGKLLPKKIRNALGNAFSRTLSPKELQKLKGAMAVKFARKADNPSVLTAIVKTNLDVGGAAGLVTRAGRRLERSVDIERYLASLKRSRPQEYEKFKTNILSQARLNENPLFLNFMNSEVNALKTFISKPGTFVGSAFARWQNMAPIVWNEIKDVGEDVLMAAGIETKDDINGLFWPMLKSGIDAVGYVSPTVAGFKSDAGETIGKGYEKVSGSALGTILGAPIKAVTGGLDSVEPYDPNVKFQIVPDEDPRLTKQKEKKKKDIEQRRSWF